jgi:ankyrin repeat protein
MPSILSSRAAFLLGSLILAVPLAWGQQSKEDDLVQAVMNGSPEEVSKCLDAGAKVNALVGLTRPGSVLCYSIEAINASMGGPSGKHLEVIKLLVARGAKVDLAGPSGGTALMKAASSAPNQSPAVRERQLAAVRLLLELGAKVKAVDEHKSTALHYAAFRCWPEMISLLLAHGADRAALDDENHTPAQVAEGMPHLSAKEKTASLKLLRNAR